MGKSYGPEWPHIRKAVIERDGGRCRKCGRTHGLEAHHIIPRREDGTDDLENLATLCSSCHIEWECVEASLTTSFTEWLTVPPIGVFVAAYLDGDWSARYTAADMWQKLHDIHVAMLNGVAGR